jgi:hypothetical protein
MFAIDSLVIDLVFGAAAKLSPEIILDALGGEEVAQTRVIVDPDLDLPQYEMEVSPTVPLRRRGERRLLIVDESVAPLRKDPSADPIVARDLRSEKQRLVDLVEKTGARLGRLCAFGTWGDAAIVVRSARDLRGLMLLGWALDPTTDIDGRRRATPLSKREFEEKLLAFDKRLDEVPDATLLARIPPGHLERRTEVLVVDVLSDVDGSWDIRKSYELEKRVSACELFAKIPGARVIPEPEPAPPPPETPAPTAAPTPPQGPPIRATHLSGRVFLWIPAERFDLDAISALSRGLWEILKDGDPVSGADKDLLHREGGAFVAPLSFLSEVFLDGKPLDRRRFESEAVVLGEGLRALEAHLPRFGPVRVLDVHGKRFVSSDVGLEPTQLLTLLDGVKLP